MTFERITIRMCEACGGRGYFSKAVTVYARGCGFAHDDVEETDCTECNGVGDIFEVEECESLT